MSVIPSRAKALSLRSSYVGVGAGLGSSRPLAVSCSSARSYLSSSSSSDEVVDAHVHDDRGTEEVKPLLNDDAVEFLSCDEGRSGLGDGVGSTRLGTTNGGGLIAGDCCLLGSVFARCGRFAD
jgi:hypothetical protein